MSRGVDFGVTRGADPLAAVVEPLYSHHYREPIDIYFLLDIVSRGAVPHFQPAGQRLPPNERIVRPDGVEDRRVAADPQCDAIGINVAGFLPNALYPVHHFAREPFGPKRLRDFRIKRD